MGEISVHKIGKSKRGWTGDTGKPMMRTDKLAPRTTTTTKTRADHLTNHDPDPLVDVATFTVVVAFLGLE